MTQPKITLKINGKVLRPKFRGLLKILRDIEARQMKDGGKKLELRFVYGQAQNHLGKVEVIDNEMTGNPTELLMGAEAFWDKDLWL